MYHVRVKEALRRSEYGQLELERLVIRREIFRVESVRTVRGRKEEGERERETKKDEGYWLSRQYRARRTWLGLINRFQVSPAPPRGRLSPVILTTFN